MSKIRNAIIAALDETGINHQPGPEDSLVFALNNAEADENISFFVSFLPDDEDFVTMGIHIYECGQEEYTIAMAIAGNVNATSKVAKIFPLHMPMNRPESTDSESQEDEEMMAHFFVTSQFLWTDEKIPAVLLSRYINVALAARLDFLKNIDEFKKQHMN